LKWKSESGDELLFLNRFKLKSKLVGYAGGG